MARLFDDASSEYIENLGSPITTPPITMSVWINTDNDANNQSTISYGNASGTHSASAILRGASGDVLRYEVVGAGVATAATVNTYSINTWQHVCVMSAATDDHSAYLNGDIANKGTSGTGASLSSVNAIIVASVARSSRGANLSGSAAEAGWWNVALSEPEVTMLALGMSPMLVRPESLVAYVPIMGRTSPERDLFGGFNMSLVATPTASAHVPIIYPNGLIVPEIVAPVAPGPLAAFKRRFIITLPG
jgi:hypothetical protein